MQYVSTRGHSARKSFSVILTAALAQDGGLYMPDHIDSFTHEEITALKDASYAQLATRILSYFAGDSIACSDVEQAIEKGLKRFTSPQIAPLTKLGGNRWLLELYHGPTLAFKDYALKIVAELINDQLNRTDQRAMVLCATSGDTGAAAAAAFAGRNRVKVVVLHPEGRVSDVQRRQMTTLPNDNILNVAIRGDFDDCQALGLLLQVLKVGLFRHLGILLLLGGLEGNQVCAPLLLLLPGVDDGQALGLLLLVLQVSILRVAC